MDELYRFPLFEGLPAAEVQWVVEHGYEVQLQPGDCFFREGEPAEQFYVMLEGEIQVTRTVNGSEIVLGTTPPGIIGGEVALLNGTSSQITSCALMPSRLLVLSVLDFRALFAACPALSVRIFQIATQRTQGFFLTVQHQERMTALGKLAAGLAHELNNPASAARRAAITLRETLPSLQERTVCLNVCNFSPDEIQRLVALQQQTLARVAQVRPLSPMEQSDREEVLGDWLDAQGIANGWDLAATFVTAGLTLADVQEMVAPFPAQQSRDVLAWLNETLYAMGLLHDIEQSTVRIASLVQAVKEYTYMDRAALQEVDINKGLQDTLTILSHKLTGVTVKREYDPNVPIILARGGELNQVWTNLIDNAIDATGGTGTIRLITRYENRYVMVEVADDGSGIPPDVLPRIFEPFFTTKDVGVGTGLGLDISYRIIDQHHGSIEVQSQPGNTRFIVRLPTGMLDEE